MKKLLMLIFIIMGITLSARAEGVNPPVAIKCDEGVFLSWPLDKCEEYTIYRNGEEIAKTTITNYMDKGADGTAEYKINSTAVQVWDGQFLDIPLNVPKPYPYTYPDIKHVTIKAADRSMNIGEVWTIVPIDGNMNVFLAPDGKVLDNKGVGTTVGTIVQLYDYHGGSNQKYYIEEVSGKYMIKASDSELDFYVDENGETTLAKKENATLFEIELCKEEITEAALNAVNVVVPIPPE